MRKNLEAVSALIFKHLRKGLNRIETQELTIWIRQSSGAEQKFVELEDAVSLRSKIEKYKSIDVRAGWKRLEAIIRDRPQKKKRTHNKTYKHTCL